MFHELILPNPEILDTLRQLAQGKTPLYLVGGAVRDMLLKRTSHDLDFVMAGDVRPLARRLSDIFSGDFFILDSERNTVRVIVKNANGNKIDIDFATLRSDDLNGDLHGRDFTINAMALDLANPYPVIDPLGGANDLLSHKLKACSTTSFIDDPVRIIRGVRLSQSLRFMLDNNTLQEMKKAVPLLLNISGERVRDEIFKIMEENHSAASLRVLEHLGVIAQVFPDLSKMRGLLQPTPHRLDVWEHTLTALNELERIFNILIEQSPGKSAGNLILAHAVTRLGKYRRPLQEHFKQALNPNRSIRSLLFFSTLLHDAGKPSRFQMDEGGRIRFFDHENEGAELSRQYSHFLALSQAETQRMMAIVKNHMRIHALVQTGIHPTDRAIYRFFRATGEAGIDICLLSLADTLATYGVTLPEEHWRNELDVCACLMEAWWEKNDHVVAPAKLLNGTELQEIFNLDAGPSIGALLDDIRESQAAGNILTREDAIIYAKSWLNMPGRLGERGKDGI